MHIAVKCLFFWCFLHCCSANYMNCTVTQYADQTIYNILEMSRVSNDNASRSVFTWAFTNDTVLANNDDKIPKLVVNYSIKALTTSECFDEIVFSVHPHLEKRSYKAYCNFNCTLNAPRSQKQKEISQSWIACIAICLGLGLVLVLVGLCIKFRTKISRICSRDQLRCIYTSMKMQTVHPREANVESWNV